MKLEGKVLNNKGGNMTHRIRTSGTNTSIINILRDYNRDIPVGFLAKELSISVHETEKYLENLENHGIVKIHNNFVGIIRDNH